MTERYTQEELKEYFYEALSMFNEVLDIDITPETVVIDFFTPSSGFAVYKTGKTQLGHQRVDKLLCTGLDESSNERYRRSFAYTAESNYLEAMENAQEAAVGIAEIWDRKRLGKTDGILWRPLSMGSYENVCGQGNLKRKAVTSRICQLL